MIGRQLVVVFLTASLLACKSDSTPFGPNDRSIDLQVTVQTLGWGAEPEYYLYSWTSGIAASVSVTRTAEPSVVVWEIASSGEGIRSPVYHGQVPSGATRVVAMEPLLTAREGVQYRVSVRLHDGRTAWTDFTP